MICRYIAIIISIYRNNNSIKRYNNSIKRINIAIKRNNKKSEMSLPGLRIIAYAVQVRLVKGHSAGVTTVKSMRTEIFFLLFDPRFFPPFSSLSLFFFSSPLSPHGIFTARLFGSRSFGLGRVILRRQCGKMNYLEAKTVRFFRTADIHTIYSLCTVVFICTKPLDVLTYTSV